MTSVSELFERHHLSLFRYLRRMTGRDDLAEDLTQETFLRAIRTPPDDPELRERAWLFRVARNLLLNRSRDASRQVPLMPVDGGTELDSIPSPPRAPEEALDLDRALAALNVIDRDVFLMREQGGLGYEEIATLCGLGPDAVRSRICRARVALRAALTHESRRLARRPSTEARS